jgi:hypothetical protein
MADTNRLLAVVEKLTITGLASWHLDSALKNAADDFSRKE